MAVANSGLTPGIPYDPLSTAQEWFVIAEPGVGQALNTTLCVPPPLKNKLNSTWVKLMCPTQVLSLTTLGPARFTIVGPTQHCRVQTTPHLWSLAIKRSGWVNWKSLEMVPGAHEHHWTPKRNKKSWWEPVGGTKLEAMSNLIFSLVWRGADGWSMLLDSWYREPSEAHHIENTQQQSQSHSMAGSALALPLDLQHPVRSLEN